MILAFDPGITTGWAGYHGDHYGCGQIDSKSLLNVYGFISEARPDVIVYEDFKHRPQLITAELYSIQLIGTFRLWSELHGFPEPTAILPAKAKAFWTDDKLKALSLWHPGKPHAMD